MKHHIIQFIIMVIVGILFNPSYRFNDLYLSLTLFYGGLLILFIHFSMGHFNIKIFINIILN